MYVAELTNYWAELLEDEEYTSRIPYLKDEPSLPKILSRKDLKKLFDACANDNIESC